MPSRRRSQKKASRAHRKSPKRLDLKPKNYSTWLNGKRRSRKKVSGTRLKSLKSPKRLDLKPSDYSVWLNGKPLSGVKVSLSTISPGKIRVYVSYPNGRVYNNISPSSQKFSFTKLEWVYVWHGPFDDEKTGRTRTRTLTFRFQFISETRFKQVHRLITNY